MALIKCPECGKEYSNLAAACPNCGCPTNHTIAANNEGETTIKKKITHQYEKMIDGDNITIRFKKLPTLANVWCWVILLFNLGLAIYNLQQYAADYTPFILIRYVFFAIWLLVSTSGIIVMKRWGLYSLLVFEIISIILLLLSLFTEPTSSWADLVMESLRIAIFLCVIFFSHIEEYSAFDIIMNNGIIRKQSELPERD